MTGVIFEERDGGSVLVTRRAVVENAAFAGVDGEVQKLGGRASRTLEQLARRESQGRAARRSRGVVADDDGVVVRAVIGHVDGVGAGSRGGLGVVVEDTTFCGVDGEVEEFGGGLGGTREEFAGRESEGGAPGSRRRITPGRGGEVPAAVIGGVDRVGRVGHW